MRIKKINVTVKKKKKSHIIKKKKQNFFKNSDSTQIQIQFDLFFNIANFLDFCKSVA